uniref:Transmembrane protein n=1 Tax=Globodera rostochiensis TaxID=31243 RepID=A0A914HA71_GLORO
MKQSFALFQMETQKKRLRPFSSKTTISSPRQRFTKQFGNNSFVYSFGSFLKKLKPRGRFPSASVHLHNALSMIAAVTFIRSVELFRAPPLPPSPSASYSQEKGNCPFVRPFRLPHSTRKMRKCSFVWHRMLFLLCGLFLLASLSQFCNSTPIHQQKRQQQLSLTKRFYAWDEMSAKRSLVPPLSNDAKLAIEQSETNADESEPLLESHSAGLDSWKQRLSQKENISGTLSPPVISPIWQSLNEGTLPNEWERTSGFEKYGDRMNRAQGWTDGG